jgi:hypothetical protein
MRVDRRLDVHGREIGPAFGQQMLHEMSADESPGAGHDDPLRAHGRQPPSFPLSSRAGHKIVTCEATARRLPYL